MASAMVLMPTEGIGLAADILRDEIDMRLLLLLANDDSEERPTDEDGEMDRGVEMSELEGL